MKTAVIVLNYNSSKDTIRYVNEIKEYSVLDTIVVVDNNSTINGEFDKLKELESNKVFVLKAERNGGYSYGNNIGLKFIDSLDEKYDYVVISNPDVEVKEEAFERCFKELTENTEVAMCSPIMLNRRWSSY